MYLPKSSLLLEPHEDNHNIVPKLVLWSCALTAELAKIGLQRSTTKCKNCKFLLWLLYIYTLFHKHVSTATVDEFIAFIAAFVCWNRCNLLDKIAGGRDSLIFYLTKNCIQYKTSFLEARYSFHVWFINIEIDKTLHMSRKSVVNKTFLSPLYSKCLAINI